MLLVYGSIILAIASGVIYHLIQKILSQGSDPFAQLSVAYAVSLFICVIGWQWGGVKGGSWNSLSSSFTWPNLLLGLAIVGIEVGFFLVYKAGWSLGTSTMLINGTVVLLLLPIGIIFFKNSMSLSHLLGVTFCAAGVFLMSKSTT